MSNLQMVAPIIDASSIETIWSNYNISSIYSMLIHCNTSKYKLIVIVAVTSVDNANDLTVGIIDPTIQNKHFFISRSAYLNMYRSLQVLSDGINVENGFRQTNIGNRVIDDTVIIPIKVIGIQ